MPPRALLLAGGVLTGCASPPAPPPAPVAAVVSPSCLLPPDSRAPARVTPAAFDAPADAVRATRAASLEAPVRLDCEGRASPGLAIAWSRDTTGRFWTLELRD